MYVRKVRGQNKVGKIILTPTEIKVVSRMGVSVEKYVKVMLVQIAKKRRWHWYLNRGKV